MSNRRNQALFMETTEIPVEKTVTEIQMILAKFGCSGVMTMFNENKEVAAVCFQVMFLDRTIPFKLPCRWEAIYQIFLKRRAKGRMVSDREAGQYQAKAKRIAWRQVLRWVEAQLALVETDMVKVTEVFLPYIQVNLKQTFYEKLEEKGLPALKFDGFEQ